MGNKNKPGAKSVRLNDLLECPICNGMGTVKKYPYYSIPMPNKVDVECDVCLGRGKIMIIDTIYKVYPTGAL